MLKNDPPPGTTVKFTREVRKARANDFGKLMRALRTYYVKRPEDEFEVEYRGGERMVVRRDEIEQV